MFLRPIEISLIDTRKEKRSRAKKVLTSVSFRSFRWRSIQDDGHPNRIYAEALLACALKSLLDAI